MKQRSSEAGVPITFLSGAHNEEARICYVLEHAVRWANEIIIVNKSPKERAKKIYLKYYGYRVKVIDVPYSLQDHED